MTSPSDPDQAWRRLADLLIQRRVDMDARYRNRRTFCTDRDIDYRVISDLEGARRTNFSRPVIAQIENAYALARGNIQRILQGGGTEPLDAAASTPSRTGPRVVEYDDGRKFAVEVDTGTDMPMEDALAVLGELTKEEKIVVANLRAMEYGPAAVAGAIMLLRRHADQLRGRQGTGRLWKDA